MTGTTDLPPNERIEVSPGVTIERRGLLGLAAGTLAFGHGRPAASASDLPSFLEAARAALERPADTPEDELRYLYTLAALTVGLEDVRRPTFRPTPQGEDVGIGVHPGGDPFVVLHWRMEPGAVIRTHPHTYGHVVTVPLAGAARVRNYEVLDRSASDSTDECRVRLTTDQTLSPGGGVNLVPLHRGYCHGFVAGPDGAEGLDLTTRVREKQATRYLEIGERLDGWERVFRARWTE